MGNLSVFCFVTAVILVITRFVLGRIDRSYNKCITINLKRKNKTVSKNK